MKISNGLLLSLFASGQSEKILVGSGNSLLLLDRFGNKIWQKWLGEEVNAVPVKSSKISTFDINYGYYNKIKNYFNPQAVGMAVAQHKVLKSILEDI